jgi:predicted ester cyclase
MGIPATGKKISFTETHIVRIANGKAVEHWGNQDDMGTMQQLGVIPTE